MSSEQFQQLIKALLMLQASVDAHAVVSNLPDDLKLDPTIADEGIRQANLLLHEEKRIHYHTNVAILASEHWPAPQVASSGGGLTEESILNLLANLSKSPVIDQALKALGSKPPALPIENKP